MAVVPAAALLLCLATGTGGMVGAVVILLEACPCAAITSVFAVQYHYDEELAAGSVVVSTLLSIVVLPAFALLSSSFEPNLLTLFISYRKASGYRKSPSSRHVRMDGTHTGKFAAESVRGPSGRVRGSAANFVPRGILGGRNFCPAQQAEMGSP